MPSMRPPTERAGAAAAAEGTAPEGVAPKRPTRYPAAQRDVAGIVLHRGARAEE
jgi:hypothetical protein